MPLQYIRNCHIVLLVFSNLKTFESLKNRWYKFYKKNCNIKNSRFILVGNKCDIFGEEREEIIKKGDEFAQEIDALFMTCSAKNADNMRDQTSKEVSKAVYIWGKKKAAQGWISLEEQAAVYSPDVVAFLSTELGQRIGSAFRRGELFREKPFMMGGSASELDGRFPEEEMVIVQGIIDAWFIENGEIVLLD